MLFVGVDKREYKARVPYSGSGITIVVTYMRLREGRGTAFDFGLTSGKEIKKPALPFDRTNDNIDIIAKLRMRNSLHFPDIGGQLTRVASKLSGKPLNRLKTKT